MVAKSTNLITRLRVLGDRRGLSASLFCILIVSVTAALFSRNNQFSSFYHPDEGTKAAQILERARNYRHPQLLLESVEVALKVSGSHPPQDLDGVRQVILTGRNVSAVFAVLTVVSF